MALVTLAEAKDDLRVTHYDDDVDIQAKINAASALVVAYVTDPAAETWDEATAPPQVREAVKRIVGALYDGAEDVFDAPARALLHGFRDPALA